MNVLESLKINNSTVLSLKEGDILFVRVDDNMNDESIVELNNSLLNSLNEKGFNDITIWISRSVNDLKIIRR